MTIKLKLFFMFIMLPPLLYGQNKLVEESIIYSSDVFRSVEQPKTTRNTQA